MAWVNIHRMTGQTLRVLLADHLVPTLARLDGELDRPARRPRRRRQEGRPRRRAAVRPGAQGPGRAAGVHRRRRAVRRPGRAADRRQVPRREQDARYAPDLDDGVMINSAALWPLLDPQWKDPKKWWKELATASGRKDYDWSHLAMRYWPDRVDRKCPAGPEPRRRARLLLAVPPGARLDLGAAAPGRDRSRLPNRGAALPPRRPRPGRRRRRPPPRRLPARPAQGRPRRHREGGHAADGPRQEPKGRARDAHPRDGSLVGPRRGPLGDGAAPGRAAGRGDPHPRPR